MRSQDIKDVIECLSSSFNIDQISDHPAMIAAEKTNDEKVLSTVASSLVMIDSIIKSASRNLSSLSDSYKGKIDESDIDAIATLASEFDKTNDEFLKKYASVLDQILINFGQISGIEAKEAQEKQIQDLIQKYRDKELELKYSDVLKQDKKNIKAEEASKAIAKQIKQYRPLEAPLLSRTCPDHPGAQMMRVADSVFQCALDKKIYNYKEGFTTMNGNVVPGTSVENQTNSVFDRPLENMSFSTREDVTKQ